MTFTVAEFRGGPRHGEVLAVDGQPRYVYFPLRPRFGKPFLKEGEKIEAPVVVAQCRYVRTDETTEDGNVVYVFGKPQLG